ncbi:hypothetical protein KQI86_07825 [Clostridium sp. MSJ-11]|uniref:MEDS domain-containing protein n=1 Tax=Clostridium mobile TaxID=2841512 RepID=A0ABS6EG86_9CLOT|nr:hypothetical protein [Clostridium mobile]MBU5484236.1 hypothetical protein [Clostridium mobile]
MKKINFQFHARNDEIADFLQCVVAENGLKAYGIILFPYCREDISEEICINYNKVKKYKLIVLSRRGAEIAVEEQYDQFIFECRGDLFITIGKDNGIELFESAMGAVSDNDIDKLWIKIISHFKRRLLKGAFVTSPNGLSKYYPNHRYSDGAKQAYDSGVIIRPIAGWNYYELKQSL